MLLAECEMDGFVHLWIVSVPGIVQMGILPELIRSITLCYFVERPSSFHCIIRILNGKGNTLDERQRSKQCMGFVPKVKLQITDDSLGFVSVTLCQVYA